MISSGSAPNSSASKQLEELGICYFKLVREYEPANLRGTAICERYFGNSRNASSLVDAHHSLARRTTEYTRLLDRIHKEFRDRLPERLPQLDVKRLDDRTQGFLRELRTQVRAYRQQWKAVENGAKSESEIRPVIDAINTKVELLCGQLEYTQLGAEGSSLPVCIGDKQFTITNWNNVGIFLLALRLAMRSIVNEKKIPSTLVEFISGHTQSGADIQRKINDRLVGLPALHEASEAACGQCLDDILTLVRENSRPLQMAQLANKGDRDAAGYQAVLAFLSAAGVTYEPARLENMPECAVVAEAMVESLPQDARVQALGALVQMARPPQRRISARVLETAHANASRLEADEGADPALRRKAHLIAEFLGRQIKRVAERQP